MLQIQLILNCFTCKHFVWKFTCKFIDRIEDNIPPNVVTEMKNRRIYEITKEVADCNNILESVQHQFGERALDDPVPLNLNRTLAPSPDAMCSM